MNKYDFGMVFLLILFISFFYFSFNNVNSENAVIKYNGEVIKTIELGKEETRYFEVEGDLGLVVIEVKDYQARVVEETSPLNICSNMGWRNDIIVCLPNRVVIEMVADDAVDTIVR